MHPLEVHQFLFPALLHLQLRFQLGDFDLFFYYLPFLVDEANHLGRLDLCMDYLLDRRETRQPCATQLSVPLFHREKLLFVKVHLSEQTGIVSDFHLVLVVLCQFDYFVSQRVVLASYLCDQVDFAGRNYGLDVLFELLV